MTLIIIICMGYLFILFRDELLRDVERSKQAGATNEYRSTYHVSPTSNIV